MDQATYMYSFERAHYALAVCTSALKGRLISKSHYPKLAPVVAIDNF